MRNRILKIVIEEITSRMEKWDIHFSGMLLSINWWLVTEILDILWALCSRIKRYLKDGNYRLSRNDGN
jgi:hypothetical protein